MILTVFTIALFVLTVPILIASVTLALQLAAAATAHPSESSTTDDSALARCAVIIPAHDEEAGIGETLASIKAQSVPSTRIIVVADNCTDATAAVARAAGAEVLERTDPVRRGKGYALDHAVRALARDPTPSIVIFIDADCWLEPGSLSLLAAAALKRDRPVQACYLMVAAPGADVRERLRGFAFKVRNLVRPMGGQRLGFPAPLTGSGMAFPWHVIAAIPLASGHIVEDLKLGMDSALAGFPVSFCAQARVLSAFPQTRAGVESQTARWEHGHFQLMRSHAPRLIAMAVWRRRPELAGLALDLLVPPIGLLFGAGMLCLMAGLIMLGLGARSWLLLGAVVPLPLLVSALFWIWLIHGRNLLQTRELFTLFVHSVAKMRRLPGLLGRREHMWVRSDRGRKESS
jgi:cellulose synthase/poly-beta-1,6-N-acetylglucosamine synthase-like glycosyltransferase